MFTKNVTYVHAVLYWCATVWKQMSPKNFLLRNLYHFESISTLNRYHGYDRNIYTTRVLWWYFIQFILRFMCSALNKNVINIFWNCRTLYYFFPRPLDVLVGKSLSCNSPMGYRTSFSHNRKVAIIFDTYCISSLKYDFLYFQFTLNQLCRKTHMIYSYDSIKVKYKIGSNTNKIIQILKQ